MGGCLPNSMLEVGRGEARFKLLNNLAVDAERTVSYFNHRREMAEVHARGRKSRERHVTPLVEGYLIKFSSACILAILCTEEGASSMVCLLTCAFRWEGQF